ncbi:MAG: homocysteine S-methyltransferase family protein [Clostridia bacterium]|nr:homocysteine S-methyltransferase family protein [Clostridia bacterium]
MNFNTLYPNFPFSLPMLLDGATGTALFEAGMPTGVCPEEWILSHPDVICKIQSDYIHAGSDAVLAPTFGANRTVLSRYGLDGSVSEMNTRLADLSRKAIGSKLLAADLSPTGKMLAPVGDTSLEEMSAVFSEQASALDSLVDFYMIETQMDLACAKAAVLGVKAVSEKPVFVTMTVTESGKTMYGDTPKCALLTLSELGIAAFGLNCSTGPKEMKELIAPLFPLSVSLGIPLIAKPNAGAPQKDGSHSHLTPEEFASVGKQLLSSGICILGGCCGTNETVISALHTVRHDATPSTLPALFSAANIACTARETVEIPISDMPDPILPDEDLIESADEMSEDYDFLYFSVRTNEDAEAILDAAPFLTLPIAVCGNEEAINLLRKKYCGKIVTVSDNG